MKYPIGVQNFGKIRRDGYLYIDKTELVYKLVSDPHWRLIFRERKSCSAVWLWRGWRRNGRQDRCCTLT